MPVSPQPCGRRRRSFLLCGVANRRCAMGEPRVWAQPARRPRRWARRRQGGRGRGRGARRRRGAWREGERDLPLCQREGGGREEGGERLRCGLERGRREKRGQREGERERERESVSVKQKKNFLCFLLFVHWLHLSLSLSLSPAQCRQSALRLQSRFYISHGCACAHGRAAILPSPFPYLSLGLLCGLRQPAGQPVGKPGGRPAGWLSQAAAEASRHATTRLEADLSLSASHPRLFSVPSSV